MRTLACILLTLPLWAGQNLTTTMTGIGTVSFAGVSITASTPLRWEFAYDSFSTATADSSRFIGFGPNSNLPLFGCRMSGTVLQCIDDIDTGAGFPSRDIAGWDSGTGNFGFSARFERDPAHGTLSLTTCKMNGTSCSTSTVFPSTWGTTTIAGANIGRAGAGGAGNNAMFGKLALMRLSTSLAGTTRPPNAHNAPAGNALDWEFDGSITDSVRSATWSLDWGAPGYTSTVARLPVCDAGTTKILRAGVASTLDGSNSYALDGNTVLNAVWQQAAGPAAAVVSSNTATNPTISGLVFGQFDFHLVVSDASGNSAGPCSVSYGVVATDAQGSLLISNPVHAWILNQTNPANPESGTGVPAIFDSSFAADGTGIRAYPFFQTQMPINTQAVLTNLANVGVGATAEWNVGLAGTVSFVSGCSPFSAAIGNATCSVITGVGTQFQTDFCGGPGSTSPSSTRYIVIWYNSLLISGTTGRRMYPVNSCDSQTHLTLGQPGTPWSFISDGSVDTGGGQTTGLSYSKLTESVSGYWYNGGATGAYYDTPLGVYYMWYATGLNYYRDQARQFVDTWFSEPHVDGGAQQVPDSGWWQLGFGEARVISLVSMIMRAADGRPEMWPGIRKVANFVGPGNTSASGGVPDLRDAGYVTVWYAMLSLFDPDATQRSNWYAALQSLYTNMWTPYAIQHGNDIWWNALDTGGGASSTGLAELKKAQGGSVFTGTASVTNGSASVSGSGTNFLTSWQYNGSSTDTSPTGTYPNNCYYIWFTDSANTSVFLSNRDINGDADAYKVASFNSNTSITLTRAYTGTTGTKNYVCTGYGSSADNTMITVVQPFMEGIAMQGHVWAREAARYLGDSTLQTTAQSYAVGAANFMYDRAYDSTNGGHTYFEVTPTAEMPNRSESCYTCLSTNGGLGDVGGMRTNIIEGMHAYTVLYRFNPSPALLTEIDTRFGKAWGKPLTGALYSDGSYNDALDHGWNNPFAQYIQKWYGYCLGTGFNEGWLSSRVGGLASAQARTMKVTARIADHPLADKMRVTVIDPQGVAATPVICTSSPCTITTDARQGNHLYKVDLLSPSNSVVAAGDYARLTVQ